MDKPKISLEQRVQIIGDMAQRLNAARIASSSATSPFQLALLTDERADLTPMVLQVFAQNAGCTTAVIFRHYNAHDRNQRAKAIRLSCETYGHLFLVAQNIELANEVNADGLHLPEWQISQLSSIKDQNPDWRISTACHSVKALNSPQNALADCSFLSPVFATRSHPESSPLGVEVFSEIIAKTLKPTIALGGIDHQNARYLAHSNAAGIGAISALHGI